jgi:hypothetical protein
MLSPKDFFPAGKRMLLVVKKKNLLKKALDLEIFNF